MTEFLQSESLTEKMAEGRNQALNIRKENNIPSTLKIIRRRCLDCVCGSAYEVRMCHLSDCAAWPYRFGRSPRADDLLVPCYDRHGNLTGYRNYEGFPQEVDGMPSRKDTIVGEQGNESDR